MPEQQSITEERVLQILQQQEERRTKEAEAKAADEARINAEVEKRFKEKMQAAAKTGRPALFPDENPDPVTVYSKYHDMAMEDLALLATIRGEAKCLDEALARELADRSFKAIDAGKMEAKCMSDAEFKANEVMQTTLASYGTDWVFTNYSSQLWLKARSKSRLFGSGFIPEQEIPKGYKSDTIPLEGTDISFYNVAQAADNAATGFPNATIPSSQEGTANKEITVGKLGARVEVTGELEEDSIIDSIPEIRAKLERQIGPEMDFLFLNGDSTAAVDNINGNGTPTAGADYTTIIGILRVPLKTNTANMSDAGAAITSAKIRTMYGLLGPTGEYVWDDPTTCRVFSDFVTWGQIMGLSDLLTVNNAGADWATIVAGIDPNRGMPIHGVTWMPSTGVKPAHETGFRLSGTNAPDGSDTKGRAVLIRGDQWKIRWKRRAKYETNRIARADVTELIVTLRFGIGYYDTDAAALLYNI